MKCILIITILWIINYPFFCEANWCIKNTTKNIQVTSYRRRIKSSKNWYGRIRTKEEVYRVTEIVPTVKHHQVCCEGYTLNMMNRRICEPICPGGCPQFADCSEPNLCRCMSGYEIKGERCVPICEITCDVNAVCSAPNECQCKYGFYKKCERWCKKNCISGGCLGPDNCFCVHEFLNAEICVPDCKQNCMYGECSKKEVCICWAGFEYNESANSCLPSKKEETTALSDIDIQEYEFIGKDQSDLTSTAKTETPLGTSIVAFTEMYEVHPESTVKETTISTTTSAEMTATEIHLQSTLETITTSTTSELLQTPIKSYEQTILPNQALYLESTVETLAELLTTETRTTSFEQTTEPKQTTKAKDLYCPMNCENGVCIAGNCQCNEGFVKVNSSSNKCEIFLTTESKTEREGIISSENPEVFSTAAASTNCAKGCFYGNCTNGYCQCPKGSAFNHLVNDCTIPCRTSCLTGICQENGVCHCLQCALNYCDQKCINGICIGPNKCKCEDGFILNMTNLFECAPLLKLSEKLEKNDKTYPWIFGLLGTVVITTLGLFIVKKLRKDSYNVEKIEKLRHVVQFDSKNEQFV